MQAADLTSEILLEAKKHAVPGVSTFTIDAIIEKTIKKLGARSYNKGYHPKWARYPYPTVSCISVNNTIAHGIPSEDIVLQNGDIVNIDVGIIAPDGLCGDAAFTLPVGEISNKDEALLRYAKKILYAGISRVRGGVLLGEVVAAMHRVALERNYKINQQMAAHYIGKHMHEDAFYQAPNPYNTKKEFEEYEKFMSRTLEAGQILCLEPCITEGDPFGQIDDNGWVLKTRDGAKSAMFEHMIKITPDGHEILTTHFDYKKGDSGRG